jgi:hypothetical protein
MENKEKQTLRLIKDTFFVFLITTITLGYCHSKREHDKLVGEVELKDQNFTKEKTKSNQTIAIQEQRILELNKENMKLVKTIKDFKKISGQTQVVTNTIIQEVKVPYEVQVIKYIDTLNKAIYVRVPLPFKKNDSFYSIMGKVNSDALIIDSLKIPNTLTITTGLQNGGFFKKDKYIVEVVSDNPYADITKVKNTQFEPKTPWYKTRGFAFGIGFLIPFFLIFK